jgi:hypothetical protein
MAEERRRTHSAVSAGEGAHIAMQCVRTLLAVVISSSREVNVLVMADVFQVCIHIEP